MSVGTMHLLDQTGDTEIKWNSDNPDEVSIAKAAFKKAKKRGHIAYRAKWSGGRGEVISDFDPMAEKIIFAPMSAGG